MIINALTPDEFESILNSILTLEPMDSIFNNIYRLFHLPLDKKPYGTVTKDAGTLTTYKSFELEIK